MRKFGKLTAFWLLALTFLSFQPAMTQGNSPIVGVWQGVEADQQHVQIEFTADGEYRLRIDGQPLTDNVQSWGKVKYSYSDNAGVVSIVIFGETAPDAKAHLRAAFTPQGLLLLEVCTDQGQAVHGILLKKA